MVEDLSKVLDVNSAAIDMLDEGPEKADAKATILSHQANLAESLGTPERAIELNMQGYHIRLHEAEPKQNLISFFENNLAFCHNTANKHAEALTWFEKSRDRWISEVQSPEETPPYPAFIKKNISRCLVYLGELTAARELLSEAVHELKSAKPLNWAMLA